MSLNKRIIRSERAPAPIGPYSQATRLGDFIFTAGVGGIDPETNRAAEGGIEEQTRQTLTNLQAILEAAGSSLHHVLKTTCYLADLAHFPAFNAVYGSFFLQNPPARTTIQAARLPLDLLVEIEAIAHVNE